MNAKQTATVALAPTIATVAPPLLLIGGIVALAAWLLSDDDKKKPEKPPEKATVARPPLPFLPNSGGNSAQNPCIPPNSVGKTTVPPSIAPFPANSFPTVPKITVPPPKKTITKEIMAKIFNNGGRKLDRKAAVTALKALGFRKSAAYGALDLNGRFSPCLQFASDGIISWKS